MSTQNISLYGELMKIILQLSSNTLLICSTANSVDLDQTAASADQDLHCLPILLHQNFRIM